MITKITVKESGLVRIYHSDSYIQELMSVEEAKKDDRVEVRRAISRLWPIRF